MRQKSPNNQSFARLAMLSRSSDIETPADKSEPLQPTLTPNKKVGKSYSNLHVKPVNTASGREHKNYHNRNIIVKEPHNPSQKRTQEATAESNTQMKGEHRAEESVNTPAKEEFYDNLVKKKGNPYRFSQKAAGRDNEWMKKEALDVREEEQLSDEEEQLSDNEGDVSEEIEETIAEDTTIINTPSPQYGRLFTQTYANGINPLYNPIEDRDNKIDNTWFN